MAILIHGPNIRTSQPASAARISPKWASRGIAAIVPRGGLLLDTFGRAYTPNGAGIVMRSGAAGYCTSSPSNTTDTVQIAANSAGSFWTTPSAQVTAFVYLKRLGDTAGNSPIWSCNSPDTSPFTAWGLADAGGTGTLRAEFAPGGSYTSIDAATGFTGRPQFIVFTYDGVTARIYSDGVEVASQAASGALSYVVAGNAGVGLGNFYDYTGTGRSFNGEIYLAGLSAKALAAAEIAALSANPWQVFAPQRGRALFALAAAGGNVTIALTGVSATGAVGNLGPQIAYALTGVAATAAVGSLSSALAYGLTGVAGTGSVGSLGPSISYGLSGVAGTGAVGTIGNAVNYALTGVSATGGVGTLVANVSYGLTGVAATGAVGTLGSGSDVTIALTGVSATGVVGSLGPAINYALTGVQGSGAAGSLTASPSYALIGVQASGAVGSFGPGVSYGLTGVQATGQVGDLARSGDVTIALTGVQATGQVGNLGVVSDGAGIEPFPGPYGSGGGGERTDSRSGQRKPTRPRNIALEQEEALREAVLIAEADEEEDIAMIVAILAATGVL